MGGCCSSSTKSDHHEGSALGTKQLIPSDLKEKDNSPAASPSSSKDKKYQQLDKDVVVTPSKGDSANKKGNAEQQPSPAVSVSGITSVPVSIDVGTSNNNKGSSVSDNGKQQQQSKNSKKSSVVSRDGQSSVDNPVPIATNNPPAKHGHVKGSKGSFHDFFFGSNDNVSVNGSDSSQSIRKNTLDTSSIATPPPGGHAKGLGSRGGSSLIGDVAALLPKIHRKSLDPSDKEVVKSRKKWMKKEKAKVADDLAKEWEEIFKDMAHGQKKNKLTKQELKDCFAKMGTKIDEELIYQVFVLFDANGDGVVDLTEFMVAMLFLSYRGSVKDKVELAFRLFDTNRSNYVSKHEFSDMVSAVVGMSLPTLLKIGEAEELFRGTLESEYATELLEFVEEVERLKNLYHPSPSGIGSLPVSDARALINKYIVDGSPKQLNVSEKLRNFVVLEIEKAEKSGSLLVSWKPVYEAEKEILGLLQRDRLPRFKKRIRTSMTFADMVWGGMGIHHSGGMSMKEFKEWSERHPGMFNFLDDIEKVILEEERRKEAALKIQRARRRVLDRRSKKSGHLEQSTMSRTDSEASHAEVTAAATTAATHENQ